MTSQSSVSPPGSAGEGKQAPVRNSDYYVNGVLAADRLVLSKTITLMESSLPEHQEMALDVVERLLPHTGKAIRLGITGVPGGGKSTFIETLGMKLIEAGHRVAVIAVDPSSKISGGSIMGDKTRMQFLSAQENAFVRPAATGQTLGGVARKTRESMLICEAAGFDVVIVETVGVGQLETTVASMVDFFLVLMIPGAGDELQGIKRGILELADAIVINKADGDNLTKARLAQREYETALHLVNPRSPDWRPPVLTCSALEKTGIDEVWDVVLRHREKLGATGELEARRREQVFEWTWFLVDEGLREWFYKNAGTKTLLPAIKKKIGSGVITPTRAARELLETITGKE